VTAEPIPWALVATCVGSGVLLIILGVPLALRRVPPNPTYGVRFSSTLADEWVWYEINARGGRHLIILGAGYLILFLLALQLGQSWSIERRILGPLAVLTLGLVADAIVLGVSANRLLAQRRRDQT
jgi:uncharacterized membrane protein